MKWVEEYHKHTLSCIQNEFISSTVTEIYVSCYCGDIATIIPACMNM